MKIRPVKGTRDFYPPDMARRNWIIDGWKKVSVRNGFEEYDGPIFEYLKMFQIKSGDEIVEQLFSFKDRGGRDLALRPEITPTLARMVNQKINSLPKPIKWFSVPRLFRAERPQKGRLREFFQWNIDIIGVDDVLADAEVIFTTLDYLRDVGLTNKDIKVKISSRKLLAAFLRSVGIQRQRFESIYSVLDKKSRIPSDTFNQMLEEQIPDNNKIRKILDFMSITSIPELDIFIKLPDEEFVAYEEIKNVFHYLSSMGVDNFCVFDPGIIRGLAYYTGIVFEVHDVVGDLRAICGGGRYDNLLRDFGGPAISATGMGMGDCVLEIMLIERGLYENKIHKKRLDYFIALADRIRSSKLYEITAELRRRNFSVNFSYKPQSGLVKQLKEASTQNAKKCIIIGEEFKENKLVVKDMTTGEQELVDVDKFWARLKS
jgi:histidyl-tRNA synthetase